MSKDSSSPLEIRLDTQGNKLLPVDKKNKEETT